MMWSVGQVALGGAVGSAARYLAGVGFGRALGTDFPWATLFVNVAGSFLIGVLVVVLGQLSAHRLAPLLVTGVLGGFTTFSAFALDTATLIERGVFARAAAYLAGSVTLSLLAVFAGIALMQSRFA